MAERVVTVVRFIRASPQAIFDVLADPSRHPEIDGSRTVQAARTGSPDRLSLGAKFGMDMRVVVPYRISNTVIEFEEGRRIAWRHVGGHVWRYVLEPAEGGTNVTEQFDYRPSRAPWMIELLGYPARHEKDMTGTLARLEDTVTS
jgi:hypothetical protein